jgi:hypothetical protein
MATSYSTNLALTLQGTNDNPGTWGDITNTNLGTLLEQAISGYETQALTSGVTLTLTIPNGSSGVARNMYLEFTGNGSTVIVPSNKKLYFVYNNCSSGTITMKVAGQTGVTIPKGQKQILVSNGTDIQEAVTPGLEGETVVDLTALGVNAGNSITSGTANTTIGYDAGTALTSGYSNTAVGYSSLGTATTAFQNVTVGNGSGISITSGYRNVAVGFGAGNQMTTTIGNVAIGYSALYTMTTGGGGDATYNVGIGYESGDSITTGILNTFVGGSSGGAITTASSSSGLGFQAFYTGNYSGSTCIGESSTVTGNNQVQLGFTGTTTYAFGAVQDRSDERDKADIRDTQLGLNFIMALRPRDFKWDMREDYRPPMPNENATDAEWAAFHEACKLANITHDGTHKRTRYHHGLIAQEVKQTMDSMGVDFGGYQDHTIKGGDAVLSLGYEELIAPLIKAIQELKAEFDEYKRTHP